MSRPTKGSDNWKKHWMGRGNIVTTVRKRSAYFDDPTSRKQGIGYLNPSLTEEVIYIDSLSGQMEQNQNRIAFQFGNSYNPQEEVYYVQIDGLRKPGRPAYEGIFKPQSFGLQNQEFTLPNYITTLKNSIISRTDIVGELEEYLLALVDFADTGESVLEFDTTDFPLDQIRNDFGECIGPIYCIKRGLTTYNLGINFNSKIYIPSRSNEPLLDYIIISGTPPMVRQTKVSAKSEGVSSNTLKVGDLIPLIEQNSTLLNQIRTSPEYRIMQLINDYSMVMGPIKCAEFLGLVSQEAANSISTLANGASRIPNPELFLNVIQEDQRLRSRVSRVSSLIRSGDYSNVRVTLNEISYACEKLIVNYSKQSNHSFKFTDIVKKALSNEIFFVNLSLNSGVPLFAIRRANGVEGQTLNNLILRSKHGYDSKKDKLGFAL
jgi:uncharacterized protein YlaN (UPF0358 family)